jgi:hypothetical protein
MRIIPLSMAISLIALGSAAANDDLPPGRDGGYELTANVEGTMWKGEADHVLFILRFEPGGVFSYAKGFTTYRNGTWKQVGNRIYLEWNPVKWLKLRGESATHYRGEIRGDCIGGEASNERGERWNWNVKRAGLLRNPPE